MLAEIETALIAHIKNSALGAKLRDVAGLPDLSGDSLLKRFTTDAPAIYVAPASFPVESRCAKLRFGLACVARNRRSPTAARLGSGAGDPVGLYEMLESAAALFEDAQVSKSMWKVLGIDFLNDDLFYRAGVAVGAVQIESRVKMFSTT